MIKLYFKVAAYDERMSYLRSTPRKRAHSFVQGFLKSQFRLIEDSTSVSITDIDGGGTSMSTSAGGSGSTYSAGAFLNCTSTGRDGGLWGGKNSSDNNWVLGTRQGIVVGTGSTAVTPTDFALATQIADGTSSGQLEHFSCAGTNLTTSSSQGSFDLERLFRNSSGGTITINEVGLYTSFHTASGVLGNNYCIIRDLVSPGFAVNNGEYMRIIYTISVSV